MLLHRRFLPFDGIDQFELCAAALEVVAGAVNAVIGIATEVIGQKANADFKGNKLAGKGDEDLSALVRNWPAAER